MLSSIENNYEPVSYKKVEKLLDDIVRMYNETGDINYEKIDEANELRGYDGYIAPNGDFYKVSTIYTHNPSHETWALDYVHDSLEEYKIDFKKHLLQITKFADTAGLLVHRYGYVSYTHSQYLSRRAGFLFPFDDINNVSYRQKNTIRMLLLLNDLIYYEDFIKECNGHSYLNGEEIYRVAEFKKNRLRGFKK